MATVTGLTAERMIAIEGASVIDGEVIGGHLILTKFDTTTIDAGSVIGPTGSPGVSEAELDARETPVGAILDYVGTTAPTNWLAMTGQTIVGGASTYPDLWAKLPAGMKSGSNIVMPDTRGKVSVGYNSGDTDFDTIGEVGGSKTNTLTRANLPTDTISIDPPLTPVTATIAATVDPTTYVTEYYTQTGGSPSSRIIGITPGSGETVPNLNMSATDSSSTSQLHVDIAEFESEALGSGTAHSIVQPYVVFMKIIKAL